MQEYIEPAKKRGKFKKFAIYIVLFVVILLIGMTISFVLAKSIKEGNKEHIRVLLPHDKDGPVAIASVALPANVSMKRDNNRIYTLSGGFCDGNEIICSTMTTTNPAEALSKLVSVIPKTKKLKYKVQVSVVDIVEY